ncbi:MAG TPA: hypothetical protein VFI06_10270 [Chitinophagaceae bacterium]|nr:hypothetical protein [Chitinophagaceae bacterium]
MQELKHLSLPELIDLLALQTGDYMKMLKSGASKDQLQICRGLMTQIQVEIESRKANKSAKGPGRSEEKDQNTGKDNPWN